MTSLEKLIHDLDSVKIILEAARLTQEKEDRYPDDRMPNKNQLLFMQTSVELAIERLKALQEETEIAEE